MQSFKTVYSAIESSLNAYYYSIGKPYCAILDTYEKIIRLCTDEVLQRSVHKDRFYKILSSENIFFMDREDFKNLDYSVQSLVISGIAHKVTDSILSSARQVCREMKTAPVVASN